MTVSPEMQARWEAFDQSLRLDHNVVIDLAEAASAVVEKMQAKPAAPNV